MKKDTHPKIFPAIFVDLTTGAEFISFTTRKSQETKKIGDIEYNIVKVEITSDSHPFYTGKQVILDTAGRVDKFRARMKKMEDMKGLKGKDAKSEEMTEESVEETTPTTTEEVVESTPVEAETVEEKAPAPKKTAAAKKPTVKKPAAAKKPAAKKKA